MCRRAGQIQKAGACTRRLHQPDADLRTIDEQVQPTLAVVQPSRAFRHLEQLAHRVFGMLARGDDLDVAHCVLSTTKRSATECWWPPISPGRATALAEPL